MIAYSEQSDTELWELVTQSDPYAFDEIYHRYWQKVFREANRVVNDTDVSGDLTQEVFVDLWSKRNSKTITTLSSYLYGMTRNQVFKHLRRGKIAQSHLARMARVTSANCTEQTVNLNQLQEIYSSGVAGLPKRCREVFQLSRQEQLSTQEIATLLSISPKTVENQITKALKHLKSVLRMTY